VFLAAEVKHLKGGSLRLEKFREWVGISVVQGNPLGQTMYAELGMWADQINVEGADQDQVMIKLEIRKDSRCRCS